MPRRRDPHYIRNMLTKVFRLAGLAAINLLLVGLVFVAGYYTRALADLYPVLRLPLPGLAVVEPEYPLLNEIRALLESRYIGELPDEAALQYGAARGLVSAVGDPYTVFVEPQAHELETQNLSGEYGGVGMGLAQNAAGEIVLSPFRDSPAEQAGLLEGDVLLMVDNVPLTVTTTLDAVTALVRGPIGSEVSLTVRHLDGQMLTVAITRQRIEIPSVTWKIVEGQPTVGLITISRFSGRTVEELKVATQELQTSGATRLVLDLRNNGGGILEAGVDVAAHFLDGGVVMYESQRDAPEKVYSAPANPGPLSTLPLVVLVNHNTASAAEIVAGALLDRKRAPLIGQATYGKGSVQLVYSLSDDSSLHVTAFLWYTPTRRELDKTGLPPTLVVDPATDGSDAELTQAIEYLLSVP